MPAGLKAAAKMFDDLTVGGTPVNLPTYPGKMVALPGGCGTMDELFEAITWGQLGLHEKPVGLLDADGYYGPLLSFLEHMNAEGFVRPALRLARARTAREVLDQLTAAPPAAISPPGPRPRP